MLSIQACAVQLAAKGCQCKGEGHAFWLEELADQQHEINYAELVNRRLDGFPARGPCKLRQLDYFC